MDTLEVDANLKDGQKECWTVVLGKSRKNNEWTVLYVSKFIDKREWQSILK